MLTRTHMLVRRLLATQHPLHTVVIAEPARPGATRALKPLAEHGGPADRLVTVGAVPEVLLAGR